MTIFCFPLLVFLSANALFSGGVCFFITPTRPENIDNVKINEKKCENILHVKEKLVSL